VHIGLVDLAGDPGGARTYARAIIELLQDSSRGSHRVSLIVRSGSESGPLPEHVETFVFDKHPPRPRRFLRQKLPLRPPTGGIQDVLNREGVDLAWCLAPNRTVEQLMTTPYILSIWDVGHIALNGLPEVPSGREWHRRDDERRKQVRGAAHVFTDSRKTGELLEANYGLDPHAWLSLGLPLRNFSPPSIDEVRAIREKYGRFFLYPAAFWAHKNHKVLIDALPLVDSSVELVLTGGDQGHRTKVEEYLAQGDSAPRVTILGRISDAELDALVGASLGIVMPSLLGPTNYPPLEAWAQGKNAIISTAHEFDAVPQHGIRFASPESPQEWASAMNDVASNSSELAPWVQPFPDAELAGVLSRIEYRLSLRL
jgi:glycosyltransferase involved in cell wall biosynthesis